MSLMLRLRRRSYGYLLRFGADQAREKCMCFLWTLRFYLQCFWYGIPCGRSVEIYGPVMIRSVSGNIELGDRVQIISSSWRCTASAISHPTRLRTFFPTARIVFEEGSGISGGFITARSKTIRIGKYTAIGPDCLIMDSDFHLPWSPESRNEFSGDSHDAGVNIGERVWIGARCMIFKGVTIGDNSVIAAGSVVISDIPKHSLAGGNPARVIKSYC